MKCCYKIVKDDETIGIEGIYDTEVEDRYDELHDCYYIAVTLEEYYQIIGDETNE